MATPPPGRTPHLDRRRVDRNEPITVVRHVRVIVKALWGVVRKEATGVKQRPVLGAADEFVPLGSQVGLEAHETYSALRARVNGAKISKSRLSVSSHVDAHSRGTALGYWLGAGRLPSLLALRNSGRN